MGDTRFHSALDRYERARREGHLAGLSAETGIQALGALAAETDAVEANVLATNLLNQVRRSATLLRFVGDGVVALDVDGRIQFANPAAHHLLGREAGTLLGEDFHDVVDHRCADSAPVSRERCRLLGAMEAAEGALVQVEDERFAREDGSTFAVGYAVAPIVHRGDMAGLAVVFRDRTRQQEHERTLALHAAALEAVPIPVFWVGHDGGILYANEAAAEHIGAPRGTLTRMHVWDFSSERSAEEWPEWWARMKRVGGREFDTVHRCMDGTEVPVHIRVRLVESGGEEFHVAVVERRAAQPDASAESRST